MNGYKMEININAVNIITGADVEEFSTLSEQERVDRAAEIKSYIEQWFRREVDGRIDVVADVTITEV